MSIVEKRSSTKRPPVITPKVLQLPGEKESFVRATNGAALVPNFDTKKSRIVSDCPLRAQKIAAKEHGYCYPHVSLPKDKKAEVLLRIINEYNRCGM